MKSKLLQADSIGQLEEHLNDFLNSEIMLIDYNESKTVKQCREIHNVQQYITQIMYPNVLNTQAPKVETKYYLLIIYS